MELMQLRDKTQDVVECVDNDETAAVIAQLVGAKTLLILTSADGIYADPKDPKTLVREVTAADGEEMERKIRELQAHCVGASRAGANGAKAKLEYILPCARAGMTVVIGNARWRISELLSGAAPSTRCMMKGDDFRRLPSFGPGPVGPGRALGWRLAHVRGLKGSDFRRAKVGETAGAVGANRAGLGVPVAMRKSPRARRQSRRAQWEVGRGAPLPTPSPEGECGLRERRGVGGEPGCQGRLAPVITSLRLTADLSPIRKNRRITMECYHKN